MDRWTVRQEGEKRRTDVGKEVDENTNSRTDEDEDIGERGPRHRLTSLWSGQKELLGRGVPL